MPLSSSDTNALYGFGACWAQLGPMATTCQKLDLKKIVKSTYHTYACNNLTNFSYEANSTMTGNGLPKTCLKIFVKLLQANLFVVDFKPFKTSVSQG